LPNPATEQPADLGDDAADVLVLAATQPIPLPGQAQVQSQLVELRVGGLQMLQALRAVAGVGFENRLLESQARHPAGVA
jgi:hypothetical protein